MTGENHRQITVERNTYDQVRFLSILRRKPYKWVVARMVEEELRRELGDDQFNRLASTQGWNEGAKLAGETV